MTPREAMMRTLVDFTSFPGGVADEVLTSLAEAGYVILPAAEAQAIRDKALEEAVTIVEGLPFDARRGGARPAFVAAIRALKGAKP